MASSRDLQSSSRVRWRPFAESLFVPDACEKPELSQVCSPGHHRGEKSKCLDIGNPLRREQGKARAEAQPDQRYGSNVAVLAQQRSCGLDVPPPDVEATRVAIVPFGVARSMIVESEHVQPLTSERLRELPPAPMRRDRLVPERAAQHNAAITRTVMQPA